VIMLNGKDISDDEVYTEWLLTGNPNPVQLFGGAVHHLPLFSCGPSRGAVGEGLQTFYASQKGIWKWIKLESRMVHVQRTAWKDVEES
jgi:hypothetical protein